MCFLSKLTQYLPKATYVNIMHQYHVDYSAYEYPQIWRIITAKEYLEAMRWAEHYGLMNLDPKSVAVKDFYVEHKGPYL